MRVKFYMRRVDDKIERVPFHVFSTHRFGYDDGFAWQAALEIVNEWNRQAAHPVYQNRFSYWIE